MYLSGRYQLRVKSYELRVIVETRHAASPGRHDTGDGRPAGAEEHGRGEKNVKFSVRHNFILKVELLMAKITDCSTYKGAYDAGIRIHPCGHISDLCKHKHTTLGADTAEYTEFCPLLPECRGRRIEDEALPELGQGRRQSREQEKAEPRPSSWSGFGVDALLWIFLSRDVRARGVRQATVCFLSTKSRPRYFSRTSGSLARSSGLPCSRMEPS